MGRREETGHSPTGASRSARGTRIQGLASAGVINRGRESNLTERAAMILWTCFRVVSIAAAKSSKTWLATRASG